MNRTFQSSAQTEMCRLGVMWLRRAEVWLEDPRSGVLLLETMVSYEDPSGDARATSDVKSVVMILSRDDGSAQFGIFGGSDVSEQSSSLLVWIQGKSNLRINPPILPGSHIHDMFANMLTNSSLDRRTEGLLCLGHWAALDVYEPGSSVRDLKAHRNCIRLVKGPHTWRTEISQRCTLR